MRETRNAQPSIFDFYSEHEFGVQLRDLSDLLDEQPEIVNLLEQDLRNPETEDTGANGLSIESIFRSLLLKQILQISYEKLAFHLSESPTYRAFVRLRDDQSPGRSSLQSGVRKIGDRTLQSINELLMTSWVKDKTLSLNSLRVDSTVVESNIALPLDSQLLNDGVRVLSRMMAKCNDTIGVRIRFADQRDRSKSLAFRIFNAKKPEKDALYPKLLVCVDRVFKQSNRAIDQVRSAKADNERAQRWIQDVEHFQCLLLRVVDQTQRRVFEGEKVSAEDKIVSLFEPHTDIIVKDRRDTLYGHKVNLATQEHGFITFFCIEEGNPSDKILYLPVLEASKACYGQLPVEVVADGGYASQSNVGVARASGVKRAVFNKPVGLTLSDMGVKKKTFKRLRNFRAGIEGNISELKRAFGASRVRWKGHDGFKAFVWSSVLSFNLIRMVRFSSG